MLTLYLCIYLNAEKQQITLQKISPVEGALEWFSAGGPEFEATPLPGRVTVGYCYEL